ncbi:hypothetical protein CBR_g52575 [Chara braunii]|uniref:HAT C-terminal dimerisation domain-containing protein n=1 Tax=Chara braunii TaxID=69332 RepID=A0A388MAD5_CHABU|nr:hypothetical protein CBR_g52575 [Chara braunii]|eukprot:GBG91541.1 hypothetical protein CBR_g52575 [Chara braunii]
MELEKNKPAYKWVLREQEVEPLGYGNYWHKCKLCGRLWTASYTRVVVHFTAKRDPCPGRTGKILHILASKGAKIDCPITQPVVDAAEEVTLAEFIVPPPGSATARPSAKLQQASIRQWTENTSQQRLDIAWGFHLYEHGAPFNYVTGEKTQELHELYLELGEKKQRVKMPNRMQMAIVVLDIAYEQTRDWMRPHGGMGCHRLHTDHGRVHGSQVPTRHELHCSRREQSCFAEGGRYVEVKEDCNRVGKVVGGDNVEVNKHAARLLRRRTDLNISRIPWVPCAAHCLNLLLKGISYEPCVHELYKRGKTIVKCIKNHHKTAQLFLDSLETERTRTLIMSTDVRFASVYLMLERLFDRKKVLKNMMKEGWLDIKWSSRKKRNIADVVYMTIRSDDWWREVEAAVDIMYPVYDLLRKMDKSGTAPYQLWGFEDALIKRMATIPTLTPARQESIAKKVRKRCKMMHQPVHAANFLLNPAKRDPRWMQDPECPLVQNTMKFLLSQCKEGALWGCKEQLHLWEDLKVFHKEPKGNSSLPPAKQDSLWTDFAKFDSSLDKHTSSDWCWCHGKSHPKLQRIAVRVTAMWSTATPCERNWSTLDLVHEKRRNQLSSETINKLVYVHWNLQLLKVKKKKAGGFIDIWADFFGVNGPLPAADPDILPDDALPSAEELAWRDRLRKTPYERVPKVGRVDQSSGTDNNDDGEDLRVEEEEARRVAVPPRTAGSVAVAASGGQQTEAALEETASGSQTHRELTETTLQGCNPSAESNEEAQEDGHGAQGRPDVSHVYKRRTHAASARPPPIVPSEESQPDFPPLLAELQHDNLEKSTVGRKRKEVEQTAPIATAKRGRGRPRKQRPEMVCEAGDLPRRRERKERAAKKNQHVIEDDDESTDQSGDNSGGGDDDLGSGDEWR